MIYDQLVQQSVYTEVLTLIAAVVGNDVIGSWPVGVLDSMLYHFFTRFLFHDMDATACRILSEANEVLGEHKPSSFSTTIMTGSG